MNASSTSVPTAHRSVFETVFDVAICGTGLVGIAAARELAAAGHSVLLVETTGDLLWEATRALQNGTALTTGKNPAWQAWTDALASRQGVRNDCFDSALAEVWTAHYLQSSPQVTTLFYAVPVAVERSGDGIGATIVATKAGPRRVRARQWIDATERGTLARLCGAKLNPRQPEFVRSLILQVVENVAGLEQAVTALASRYAGMTLLPSVRETERRLQWTPQGLWFRETVDIVRTLRESMDLWDHRLILSQGATRDYPVYRTPARAAKSPASNLLVLSPALADESVITPGDRFALGASAVKKLVGISKGDSLPAAGVIPEPICSEKLTASVVVAGAGTGGAMAVLAAAQHGVPVVTFDATDFPGGVGTGGGINGYFHGATGGLQSQLDAASGWLTLLFRGIEPGQKMEIPPLSALTLESVPSCPEISDWHHEAKKIVLLEWFERLGVRFLGGQLLSSVRQHNGTVTAVQIASEDGVREIAAPAYIDATGDGDLAVLAGAESVQGRPGDGRTLAYSQSAFVISTKEEGVQISSRNFDAGWLDATDPVDLSRGLLEGRAQYLREEWTSPERPAAIAPLIGLRQSRQIVTDVSLSFSDLIERAQFDDAVGVTDSVYDTHSVDFEFESDDVAFYYWVCRAFRFPVRCELPYRMLLPRGLNNVWIACRAAGMQAEAAYALRMQRDMQRLGEVAGQAAVLAVQSGNDSRQIDLASLRNSLAATGAYTGTKRIGPDDQADALERLQRGETGVFLWSIFRHPERYQSAVEKCLQSENPTTSFQAAAILASWGDAQAEPRLLTAIMTRELGPAPTRETLGAFGQVIDIPFWVQAIFLLRHSGTTKSAGVLRALATQPGLPLNVRTQIALTVERLAARGLSAEEGLAILDPLQRDPLPETRLNPSRSLWRTLAGEPQTAYQCPAGVDPRQDHGWQWQLTLARARRALGAELQPEALAYRNDPRAFVRRALESVSH